MIKKHYIRNKNSTVKPNKTETNKLFTQPNVSNHENINIHQLKKKEGKKYKAPTDILTRNSPSKSSSSIKYQRASVRQYPLQAPSTSSQTYFPEISYRKHSTSTTPATIAPVTNTFLYLDHSRSQLITRYASRALQLVPQSDSSIFHPYRVPRRSG